MAKRLSALAGLVVVLGFPVAATAQSLPMRVTTTAPATLVCNQTGTATVTLETPTPRFELMLVIDESGSISSADFTRLKNFMLDIARSFTYGPDNVRVGVVMFSTSARLVIGLNPSQQNVLNAINGIQQRGGFTCIGCGIAMADEHMQANARSGVPRFTIVLTDGQNNQQADTFAGIVASAQATSTLLAVGVGSTVNVNELNLIATDVPGVQTAFVSTDFAQLSTVLNALLSNLPSTQVGGSRVRLTVSPEFTPTAVLTSQTDAVATITGNAIEWTISRPAFTTTLTLDFHRSSTTAGAADLFSAFSYEDNEGRTATFQNATISLAGCDTNALEEEIEALQGQVAALASQVAGLEDEVATLTAANGALLNQIADLQAENESLRQQLENPGVPTGTGAISGSGQIVAGPTRTGFWMSVRKGTDGTLKAALELTVCQQVEGQADDDLRCLQKVNRLIPTLFTAVQFSDDGAFGPSGSAAQAGVDTMVMSGVGIWNEVGGYRFTLTATDRGDGAGPNDDTFHLVITAADGTVVSSATGTLAEGNIEIAGS